MPFDTSIPLQVKPVDVGGTIGGFLDLGLKRNALQRSNETLLSDIAQSKAQSSLAQTQAGVAAQTAPEIITQQQQAAKQSQIQTELQQYHLTGEYSQKGLNIATSLIQDPDVQQGNGPNIIDKLVQAKQQALSMGIPPRNAEVMFSPLITMAATDPKSVQQRLAQIIKSGQQAGEQAGQSLVPVSGQIGTGPATPSGAPSTLQRPETGAALTQAPLAQTGGSALPSTKPLLQMPQGETAQTQAQMNAERNDALNASRNVGVMHDINRSILNEVDKGTITGTAAGMIQRIKSALGFQVLPQGATDYDVLGKMLAQSNMQLAQSMGPKTNAGLQSVEAANGNLQYSPGAIREIAARNDGLQEGVRMYQQGLEKAISSSPKAEFAKRDFDQQWGTAMSRDGVDALRLKNAVDAGDSKEVQNILSKVGGKGSPGANKLFQRLQTLRNLAGD